MKKVLMALTIGREGRREDHQDPLPSLCFHSMGRGKGRVGRHLFRLNHARDVAIP